MADVKALSSISTEQTSVAIGDLLYVAGGGVPAKVTFANLMDNSYTYSQTLTVTGTVNLSGGTLTLADDQIPGAKVAAATDTTEGVVELSTTAENETGTATDKVPTVAGVVEVIGEHAISENSASTATTSGTEVDITGIPAGVTRIDLVFDGVTLSGTEDFHILLGTSGGFVTSGYVSVASKQPSQSTVETSTDALEIVSASASTAIKGHMTLVKMDDNRWSSSHVIRLEDDKLSVGSGFIDITSELTQIRLKSQSTDTFSAGSFIARWSK